MQDRNNKKSYLNLVVMAAASFVCMYVLMYAMVNTFTNVYFSLNQFYMAGLMTAPMVVIEILLMKSMYENKKRNTIIIGLSIFAVVLFWILIRQQFLVGDKQFLRSMIPHHAGAILMCEKAQIQNSEVKELCEKIKTSQQEEIIQMKDVLNRLGVESREIVLDPKNCTYVINGEDITLINGYSEKEIVPGSASKNITRYFGNEVSGDFNGDGLSDTAFLITQESGGSGIFYYAVAALNGNEGCKGTGAVFIGDRIAPQSTNFINGEIVINYADRNPGEPMTASPSVGVSKYFRVSDGQLIEINK